jgi:hypothetical protein
MPFEVGLHLEKMSTATLNITEVDQFWRVARRLHSIYSELDSTYELGLAPCSELEEGVDRREPEVLERVRRWFDDMDSRIQVWQLRQLLQSTNLQNEENLRYLIVRHLERQHKTEADKEKLDFLLVQYFAHCAPHGITEQQVTLNEVARVLEPVLGTIPQNYPEWMPGLDEKLQRLNDSNSLEELQNSGALLEVRELKLAVGDQYFEPGLLVPFTRFNFRARRAFFRAMHLDLHAIREAVNHLEQLGCTTLDCRDAGMTEAESLDQVRHVVHQWKTPFRAPYSGGSSFLQLILLRYSLERTLKEAGAGRATNAADGDNTAANAVLTPSAPVVFDHDPQQLVSESPETAPGLQTYAPAEGPDAPSSASDPLLMSVREQLSAAAIPPVAIKEDAAGPEVGGGEAQVIAPVVSTPNAVEEGTEEDDSLHRCVADIAAQLAAMPPKNSPSVSAITLGGCKLLIATWEAEAFVKPDSELAKSLQRTVAARTILHVCMERHRKGEPTDLAFALELARKQTAEMEAQVAGAKESNNIDAAVNLAATTKRLMALIDEGEKLST